jgi:hypothetical protein
MKAIIPVFKVNIFESNAVSFLKIGQLLDSHERHTFIIAFLHHTKSEICVFQIDWLHKVERIIVCGTVANFRSLPNYLPLFHHVK